MSIPHLLATTIDQVHYHIRAVSHWNLTHGEKYFDVHIEHVLGASFSTT
jgi:hypothetical protein